MKLPYIAIKNQIILPYSSDEIKVGKTRSLISLDKAKQLQKANKNNPTIVLVFLNNDSNNEYLTLDDILKYGVLAKIKKATTDSNDVATVELETLDRVLIKNFVHDKNNDIEATEVDYEYVKYDSESKADIKPLNKYKDQLITLVKELKPWFISDIKDNNSDFIPSLVRILDQQLLSSKEHENAIFSLLGKLSILMDIEDLRAIILLEKVEDLYAKTFNLINKIIKLGNIEKEISSTMRNDLDDQQRDFLLREKMRQIKKMLGEEDGSKEVDNILKNENKKAQYPDYVLETIQNEQARLASMMPSSPEANVSKTYIELLLKLPWRKINKEVIDIDNVRKILDKHHYGLEKPKKRIIEFISVLSHTKNKEGDKNYVPIKGEPDCFIDNKLFINKLGTVTNEQVNNIPILTLIGPPGVGKTTLAKSIAEALNRKFIKISLGGVKDEAEIRGHRRTYVGAMPGKIITAIKKAGVSNPVILLDEIDKMSADFRGDPVSAMLEVLDPEQNANFQDHYLDLEYDLSKVLFIATANYFDSIPAPLIDRVELLELSTYTIIEKIQIAKAYLIPKVLEQNLLDKKQFQISDDVIEYLITRYTRESGVRELKRILDSIARKIVVKILDKKVDKEFVITKEIATEFLGPIIFEPDENENKSQVGVVNGLAYTSYGGSTLAIEVTTYPGKEGLKLTGQLKDVMKESAQTALSFVRHNAKKFDITDFDFDNTTIHIHVPEGAIPKDGPSAGVTFTTSIISALSNKPVPANIGMTGEITLRGKVLPIGGLKEKSLAASKFGIKTIFIPKDNALHLVDIPEEVKKEVKFIPVQYYDEIYEHIFAHQLSKVNKESKNKKTVNSK